MTRTKRLALIDSAVAIVVLLAWLYMFFFGHGLLSTRGMNSFKFFTVDSNLLMGASALVSARYEWRVVLDEQPLWVRRLRLAATSAVMLTFLVVILFLAPPMGFIPMYLRANLAFHLVVPVTAMAAFCAYKLAHPLRIVDTLWGLVPLIAYGTYYIGSVLAVGTQADFYGFLRLAGGNIPLIACILMCATYVITFGVWLAGGGRVAREQQR